MSISLPDKFEMENKQSVDNCLLDRVATVDSRPVSEILCTTDCVVLLRYSMSSILQYNVFSDKVLSTPCCTYSLIVALVLSWLDYCSSILVCLPLNLISVIDV